MINIKPPVGQVALIPTQAQITNKFNRSNKNQYANIFEFIEAFWRKFYFILSQFNGALETPPYLIKNHLRKYND